MRAVLRWAHLILGLVVMCYIYSPFHHYPVFRVAVKFVVIPVIAFTGIWIWKFKTFNKLFSIGEK